VKEFQKLGKLYKSEERRMAATGAPNYGKDGRDRNKRFSALAVDPELLFGGEALADTTKS
jgi:hypothetical protein